MSCTSKRVSSMSNRSSGNLKVVSIPVLCPLNDLQAKVGLHAALQKPEAIVEAHLEAVVGVRERLQSCS